MRAPRVAGPSHGLGAVCGALLALACLIVALAATGGEPLFARGVHVAAASSRPSPLLPAAEDAPCDVASENAAPPLVLAADHLVLASGVARPTFLHAQDVRPPDTPTSSSLAERGPPVAFVRS